MIKRMLFASHPYEPGLVIVRIFCAIIIIPFGMEMFSAETMNGYEQWLTDKGVPAPLVMAYLGKLAELLGGALLLLGLFTRVAAFFLMITMAVVTFVMVGGSINDSTFLLLLLFGFFLFAGGGRYSVDALLKKRLNH